MLILRKLSKYISDEVSILYTKNDYQTEKGRCINTNFIGISYNLYNSGADTFFSIISNGSQCISHTAAYIYPTRIELQHKKDSIITIDKHFKGISVYVFDTYRSMFSLPIIERKHEYDNFYQLDYYKEVKITHINKHNYYKYFDTKYPNARKLVI